MTQAKDSPKPLINKPLSGQIIQLRPIVEEKISIPDDVWFSIKKWKARLQYVGEECDYLLKMIKWNDTDSRISEDKSVLNDFDRLINIDHGQLLRSINELEKEVVAAIFEGELETKSFLVKIKEVETDLKIFNDALSIVKLKVLKLIINNSRVTFY